jgi:hypothetical protein
MVSQKKSKMGKVSGMLSVNKANTVRPGHSLAEKIDKIAFVYL